MIGGNTSTYAYNGDGLRTTRTAGGTTTAYVWDVGAALPVTLQETAGGQTTYYVYGLDLIASIQGSTATYYLTDGLGSTRQLTDGPGAVTGAYTYEAFGAVRAHTGASTEWTFTGEQNDPTGLEYLRARYYDPAIGRFLTQDPFMGFGGSPQSQNRYAYVANRPVHIVDPWGLSGLSSWGDFGDCFEDAGDATRDGLTQISEGIGVSGRVGAGVLLLEVVHLPEEIAIGALLLTGQPEAIGPLLLSYEEIVWPADVLGVCLIAGAGPCGEKSAHARTTVQPPPPTAAQVARDSKE